MRLGQIIVLGGLGLAVLVVWGAALSLAFFLEPAYGLIPLWPTTLLCYPLSIAGVVYGRGYARAFSLGCLSMSLVTLAINFGLGTMLMADALDDDLDFFTGIFYMLIVKWLLVPQGGFLSLLIYWWSQPSPKTSATKDHHHPLAADDQEDAESDEPLELSVRRPR